MTRNTLPAADLQPPRPTSSSPRLDELGKGDPPRPRHGVKRESLTPADEVGKRGSDDLEFRTTSSNWNPELLGPVLEPLARSVIRQLREGQVPLRRLVGTVAAESGCQAKTVENQLAKMRDFGLLVRLGDPPRNHRLTTLGRRWLDTDEARRLIDGES